jgi:hypothetical protein
MRDVAGSNDPIDDVISLAIKVGPARPSRGLDDIEALADN